MARTAAQIQANLDQLYNLRASGIESVRHGESAVTNRDLASINSAIASEEMALASLGGQKVVREFRIRTHKGL